MDDLNDQAITTPRQMAVEFVLYDPNTLRLAIAALNASGLEAQHLPGRYDPCPDDGANTVWILVWGQTALDTRSFRTFVQDIVDPMGGTADMCRAVTDEKLTDWLASKTDEQPGDWPELEENRLVPVARVN